MGGPVQGRQGVAPEDSPKGSKGSLGFVEAKLSARPIGKQEWSDVLFMLAVFKPHNDGDGDESLFARVQAIAQRLTAQFGRSAPALGRSAPLA